MIKKTRYNNEFNTPPLQKSLSIELKQVLMQRNLLTAKSRTKGIFLYRKFNFNYTK